MVGRVCFKPAIIRQMWTPDHVEGRHLPGTVTTSSVRLVLLPAFDHVVGAVFGFAGSFEIGQHLGKFAHVLELAIMIDHHGN